jgi:hypothetical protein
MKLTQEELLELIELVRSNNEYNEEDVTIKFWGTIIDKLEEMVNT